MNLREKELNEVHQHAHQHFDTLIIAGTSEQAICAAFLTAICQRAVLAGGQEQAASWLELMAKRVRAGEHEVPH